jgi:N6-adenosine-specific RNA methylase IME4
MKDEEQRLAVKPLRGKFRTLCIDPPWAYSVHHERARPTYATMSQRELLALPVVSWADEQAHLYLWSTNADLRDAFELMEAWGFQFKTLLTWVKSTFGLGSYFRTSTEHVLFGVRGRLLTRVRNLGTHFIAAKTYHSAKPDVFYQMVERTSYPPYLDVFARKRRPGWTVWGNGIAEAA